MQYIIKIGGSQIACFDSKRKAKFWASQPRWLIRMKLVPAGHKYETKFEPAEPGSVFSRNKKVKFTIFRDGRIYRQGRIEEICS